MTAVDPLSTATTYRRQMLALQQWLRIQRVGKYETASPPTLQRNENRLSSDVILDYPRLLGHIDSANTSQIIGSSTIIPVQYF